MYQSIRVAGAGRTDTLAVALQHSKKRLPDALRSLDSDLGGALGEAIKRPEWSKSADQVTTLYPQRGAKRVLVLALSDKPDAATALRQGAGALVRAAAQAKVRRMDLRVTEALAGIKNLSNADAGRVMGEGMCAAGFLFDQFKGAAAANDDGPASLGVAPQRAMQKTFTRAVRVGASANIARTLGATPPNVANPTWLASYCRSLARKVGLKCNVIDARKAKQLKMGGLLAVGAGGSAPPAMICLEHKPRGAKGKPVLLVGKAITFDTGGYSIKPATGMLGMKYDKCGGMAVIGAMHAVAALKLPVHVVGLVPTAENMIDTDAYRPSDIITLCNGVTCEVTNTDAEGRLVLADALAYGCKHYKPKAVIDLATLTGGVVVALGSACAGCFCDDQKLRRRLFDAAEDTGERLWRLPLWDQHRDMMKSNHADVLNAAPVREAHPIQGAAFLSYFVDDKLPWAHLDIAGVATTDKDTPLYSRGPTGFGVHLLLRALETGM